MVAWSLPLISEMSDGKAPFDLRPGGYSFDEAQAFLANITDAGRDFYLNTQQLLDFFYPTLFSITVAIALVRLVRGYLGWVLASFAIAGVVLDHLENNAVAAMLQIEAEQLTEPMVSIASTWTLVKSLTVTISLLALLAALCIKGISWIKKRDA